MSVPTNSLTIKEWWVYAEHLAANHTSINHVPDTHVAYVRKEFPELQGADFQDLQSPCLIAEAPESNGIDNLSNNLLAQRFLAWTIAKRVDVQTGTYAERIDAEVECEDIAMEVLARLRAERIHRGGQVFADVKMNEWEGLLLSPFMPAGWVGYRIMVPVQVSDRRLKHDAANWTDAPGTTILNDLTGISCANLNHSTLGLTPTQRLNCLGVNVNDEDGNLIERVPAGGVYVDEAGGGGGANLYNINVWVDGVLRSTLTNVDPSVDNTLTVTLN